MFILQSPRVCPCITFSWIGYVPIGWYVHTRSSFELKVVNQIVKIVWCNLCKGLLGGSPPCTSGPSWSSIDLMGWWGLGRVEIPASVPLSKAEGWTPIEFPSSYSMASSSTPSHLNSTCSNQASPPTLLEEGEDIMLGLIDLTKKTRNKNRGFLCDMVVKSSGVYIKIFYLGKQVYVRKMESVRCPRGPLPTMPRQVGQASRAFYSTSPSSPILDQTSLPQQENVSALATKGSSLACSWARKVLKTVILA